MGVFFDKQRNRYRVIVKVEGKRKYIGQYDTKRKATNALNRYRRAQEELSHIDLYEIDVPFLEERHHTPTVKYLSLFDRVRAMIGLW